MIERAGIILPEGNDKIDNFRRREGPLSPFVIPAESETARSASAGTQ
jgi:hypothetical protein